MMCIDKEGIYVEKHFLCIINIFFRAAFIQECINKSFAWYINEFWTETFTISCLIYVNYEYSTLTNEEIMLKNLRKEMILDTQSDLTG